MKEYNAIGELQYDGEYLNGNRNGLWKFYNNKGNCPDEIEYLNGEYNGKYKKYYSNGTLSIEGEYLNGKEIGIMKDYYRNGKLKNEVEFLDNENMTNMLMEKKYINGRVEFEGKFKFLKKWEGKGFDENGNIIYELINGNGKVKKYNLDENLIYEGEYLNGKKNGRGKEYRNGKIIYEGEYLNGDKKEEIEEKEKKDKKEKFKCSII